MKRPVPGIKGTPSFGAPLKILRRVGRWSFHLEDGRTLNASQLSAVRHEAVHEETGEDKNRCGRTWRQTGRQETPQHKNRPRRQRATRPKISQYRKLHSLRGGQHCLLIRQAHHGLHQRGTRPQDWVLIVPTNQRSSISQKSSRCPSIAPHGSEDHQRDSGTMCSDLFTVETYYSFLSRVVTVSFLCT